MVSGDSNGQLTTWDIASGQLQRTWRGHEHGISPLAFSPNGDTLASGAFEHVVLWNADSGTLRHTVQPMRTRRGTNPIALRMAFTPDSASLLVGYRGRELKVWDVSNGKEQGLLQFDPSLVTYYNFAVTGDSQLIGSSRGETRGLGLWDLKTGKQIKTLPRFGGRMQFAVSPDGRQIAAGARGDKISIWVLQQDKQIDILKGHSRRYLRALAFSPDGKMLASGAEDGNVQLWNSATGDKLDTLKVGPRRGVIDQIAFTEATLVMFGEHDLVRL